MKQFLFLCLTVSGFALETNSQGVTPNPNVLNPDQIYFSDNKPDIYTQYVIRQIIKPSTELQPPYTPNAAQLSINNPSLGQFPINNPNVVQLPTIKPNAEEKPAKGFFIAQQPVYDPTVVHNRHSEEDIDAGDEKRKARFDQTGASLTNFSLSIMRNVIVQKQGNTVVSPYSIAALLSLLQQGATEQGLEQISAALQMAPQTSAAAYKSQTQDIKKRNSRNILRTANNIFVADAFSLNPQFRVVAQNDFDSGITSTKFERPDEAARQINGWVASRTNNKINNLITPESITVDTQMVLVNTIYFKGLWDIPFRPQATKPDAFRLRDGTVKNVPFMVTRRNFRAAVDTQTDSRVVVLPFEREEYSLMIILPSTLSSADYVLQTLTVPQLENYLNLKPMEVVLKMPKFTVRADTDLAPVLKQMGVTKIFDQSSGLSGLGMYRTFTPQVSSALHSAVLSIDEAGGSAAAATAFAVVALSNDEPSMILKIDRPFVAVLWDGKTKLPLFMAKIEEPNL